MALNYFLKTISGRIKKEGGIMVQYQWLFVEADRLAENDLHFLPAAEVEKRLPVSPTKPFLVILVVDLVFLFRRIFLIRSCSSRHHHSRRRARSLSEESRANTEYPCVSFDRSIYVSSQRVFIQKFEIY